MNFNKLKYFKTIADLNSITRASEHLHISQPSLSSVIKELEDEFGVSLFKRHHRGITLTAEGDILYNISKDIISRTEQAEKVMKDLGSERKALRLGIPPMTGILILPKIYNNFVAANKDISLEIVEGGYHELLRKLFDDYLDMIILPHNTPFDSSFWAESVTRLEIICCANKDNPLAKCKSITPANLKNVPIVLFQNNFYQTGIIKEWFLSYNVKPNVVLQTEQISTVSNMISNNLAVGFMFRQIAYMNSNFAIIPLEKPMYVDISLVWKKHANLSYGMKKFKNFINNDFSSKMDII